MHSLWWLTVILILFAAILAYRLAQRPRMPATVGRRFQEVLRKEGVDERLLGAFVHVSVRQRLQHLLERLSGKEQQEMHQLLIQAGWGGEDSRFYYLVAAWLLPFVISIIAGFNVLLQDKSAGDLFAHMLFGFALTFILMRRMLRWQAQHRCERIRKQVSVFLHLLRILFEAGLSLEHAFTVIQQQARPLMPDLADELGIALRRIQAGYDRGDALTDMAAPLAVAELTDTVLMLKQSTRYGGNLREQLTDYTRLLEQRQASQLREYVGKLSAKMAIVMILFLFPALMIFVAGPGLIGLTNAMKGMGS